MRRVCLSSYNIEPAACGSEDVFVSLFPLSLCLYLFIRLCVSSVRSVSSVLALSCLLPSLQMHVPAPPIAFPLPPFSILSQQKRYSSVRPSLHTSLTHFPHLCIAPPQAAKPALTIRENTRVVPACVGALPRVRALPSFLASSAPDTLKVTRRENRNLFRLHSIDSSILIACSSPTCKY